MVTRKTKETIALEVAIAGYVIQLALQLVAYFTTHFVIFFATSFGVLSSMAIAFLLLFAGFHSRKAADTKHVFGYGRAQNIASIVTATIFITFGSVEIFRQAIPEFFQISVPDPTPNIGIALVVILASIVLSLVPVLFIIKIKERGVVLRAQLMSSIEDVVAYAVGVTGIVLISKGYYLADPIVSLIVGIAIVALCIILFRDNADYLLGKSPSTQFIKNIELTALSVNGVLAVNNLQGEYVGFGKVAAGFDIEIARGTRIEEADRIAHEVRDKVTREYDCQYCTVHVHSSINEQISSQ